MEQMFVVLFHLQISVEVSIYCQALDASHLKNGPVLDCPWAGLENLGPALKGQGPGQDWLAPALPSRAKGWTGVGPGPQSIVGNTYKFINYTPIIYQIQIYLLNYIS